MNEVWKDVKGYEGKYQVSNLGRVRSLKRGIILKQFINKKGYCTLTFGDRSYHQVHRLVAEAFIENPDNLPCINHIDENPSNNFVTNLEYCTWTYNNQYGTGPERRSKTLSRPVLCVETGIVYPSAKVASKELNISPSHISVCCSGKVYNDKTRKTAGGFHWQKVCY